MLTTLRHFSLNLQSVIFWHILCLGNAEMWHGTPVLDGAPVSDVPNQGLDSITERTSLRSTLS